MSRVLTLTLASVNVCAFVVIATLLSVAPTPVAAQTVTYTDLLNFDCGSDPQTGLPVGPCWPPNPGVLAQGTDGNFYGMACDFYSRCNNGSIFMMTPSGVLGPVTYLTGQTGDSNTQVAAAVAGVTLGPDGNFYGVTRVGGDNSVGSIFRFTPPQTVTTLHSFKLDCTDGCLPTSPPVLGDDGYLYGTAGNVGYKISTNGLFSVLTTLIPVQSYASLLLASDGNFYGTAPFASGDVNQQGSVFR